MRARDKLSTIWFHAHSTLCVEISMLNGRIVYRGYEMRIISVACNPVRSLLAGLVLFIGYTPTVQAHVKWFSPYNL